MARYETTPSHAGSSVVINRKQPKHASLNETSCLIERIAITVQNLVKNAGPCDMGVFSDRSRLSGFRAVTCASCSTTFLSYEEFSSRTQALKIGCETTGVCEEGPVIFEYRRCLCCGDVVTAVRRSLRDESAFGLECRTYFTVAALQLVDNSGMSINDANRIMRCIFRAAFTELSRR